jgi:hypothetical protein
MRPATRRRGATIGPRNRLSCIPSNTYMFPKTSTVPKTYIFSKTSIFSLGAHSLGPPAGYAT